MEQLENEIWKDVAGFEGLYKISSFGRIFSLPQNNGRCGRKMGNELKPVKDANVGYLFVGLHKQGQRQKRLSMHRILATAFIPNPDNKPTVNHKNSIRDDNRLENLEWATWSENNLHAHRFGKQNPYYGENHSGAKLNWEKVTEIRSKFKKHIYPMSKLAKEYGVSVGAIQAVLENTTWNKRQTTE